LRGDKIISLLPGLTELVCALGLEDQLIGKSHECDYPHSITDRPVLTGPKYSVTEESSSDEIQKSIQFLLSKALSIYEVDDEELIRLSPDVILTQDHCEVCAVSIGDLTKSVREALGEDTRILSASPTDLESVMNSFEEIAQELGTEKEGARLVNSIRQRYDEISDRTRDFKRPDVVAIEWIDPLMTGGNWMPEMIDIAGGNSLLARAGEHSPWIEWNTIREADPDILLIVPCGYSIEKTKGEMHTLEQKPGWTDLKAVRQKQVFILDGNHYFNRPGPRIKESVEILARIFHPREFRDDLSSFGWVRYRN